MRSSTHAMVLVGLALTACSETGLTVQPPTSAPAGEGWRVSAVSVDDSYVSGRIVGGTSSFPARAIVGTSASGITVRRTFWDTEPTGQAVAGVTGATGLGTSAMQTSATYSGWSSPPWKIADGSYPEHED